MSSTVTYEEVVDIPKHPEILFIDVREQKEIDETGLIPGSILIPLGIIGKEVTTLSSEDFKKKYNKEKPDFNTHIVVTCRSGKRAETAKNKLNELGFKNVKFYPGSWLEWASKHNL